MTLEVLYSPVKELTGFEDITPLHHSGDIRMDASPISIPSQLV
jgi:hypothetical protein